MSRKSIVKGKTFERDVAKALRVVYPEARRGLAQPRDGTETPDVEGTPFWVECKVGQRINVQAALCQAQDATDGRSPLAICRADHEPATATMLLSDFITLLIDGDEGGGATEDAAPRPNP